MTGRTSIRVALLFVAATANAQQMPTGNQVPARIAADTGTAMEGREAGRLAAGEGSVAGRAAAGFLGGLPIGFLGPLVSQGDPGGAIGLGTGLAIIGAASRLGNTRPPQSEILSAHGQTYRRAYTESYKSRLLERRGKAAVLGGLAGAVTGFGILISLLSQIDT